MTQEFLIQNSWLIALAVSSGFMLALPAFRKGGPEVTVAQATQLLNQKKAVLIDIRADDMVQKNGVVSMAKRVATADLEAKIASLAKNKDLPVVVMCNSGQKSVPAAATLRKLGYTQAFSLQGGFAAWQEAGMPVKKSA